MVVKKKANPNVKTGVPASYKALLGKGIIGSATKTAKKAVSKGTGMAGNKMPSLADWLGGDGTYQDTLTSTSAALNNSLADVARQGQDYDTTFNNDLRDLGWGGAKAGWNMADALTQSGRGFANQANDFASRGMLQSSGFGDATTNLTRTLNSQLDNANLARQKFQTDLSQYGASQNQDAMDALTQAKRQAIARYGNKYLQSASNALG